MSGDARPLTVLLVAAEASGDALGAGLARAIRSRLGEGVRFVGVGGAEMAGEGVASPFDITELSVLGLVEGARAYPRVLRRADETAALAVRERPDVAVLIDSWGFTLRVAHRLRRALPALPLVKYVGPQVWATRPGRARTLARAVDLLLTIHAFDAPLFQREGLATVFVGSRALARDFSAADPGRLRARIGAQPGDRILLLLPGSRPGEVARLLPPFRDAAERLMRTRADLKLVIPVASTVAAQVRATIGDWPAPSSVVESDELKGDAMCAATVALACSGTATTELALAGVPMVVAYRMGAVSYALLKPLIRTPFVTLFNVAAGKMIAPEFLQGQCTGARLAAAVAARLDDPALAGRQVAAQNGALDRMGRGGPDPSKRAADAVLDLLAQRRTSLQPRSP